MNEKEHATIGDALIFITKGIGAALAALFVFGGVAGVIWWDTSSSSAQISALRIQRAALEQTIKEQKITIADLGSKLNLALATKVEVAHSLGCAGD